MNKGKVLLFIFLALAAAVIAMMLSMNSNDKPEEPFVKMPDSVPKEVSKDATIEEKGYFLIAEDDYLNLYSTDQNGALRKSEMINFSLFPEADVEELRKGKSFDNERDAYEMMENFIN